MKNAGMISQKEQTQNGDKKNAVQKKIESLKIYFCAIITLAQL
jgi:hypothetical protein